ncbi:hypothetical protein [Lacunimicrobium album]
MAKDLPPRRQNSAVGKTAARPSQSKKSSKPQKSNPVPFVVGGVAVVIAICVGVFWITSSSSSSVEKSPVEAIISSEASPSDPEQASPSVEPQNVVSTQSNQNVSVEPSGDSTTDVTPVTQVPMTAAAMPTASSPTSETQVVAEKSGQTDAFQPTEEVNEIISALNGLKVYQISIFGSLEDLRTDEDVSSTFEEFTTDMTDIQRRALMVEPISSEKLITRMSFLPGFCEQYRTDFTPDKQQKKIAASVHHLSESSLKAIDGFLKGYPSKEGFVLDSISIQPKTFFHGYEQQDEYFQTLQSQGRQFAIGMSQDDKEMSLNALKKLDSIFVATTSSPLKAKSLSETLSAGIAMVEASNGYLNYFQSEISRLDEDDSRSALSDVVNAFSDHIDSFKNSLKESKKLPEADQTYVKLLDEVIQMEEEMIRYVQSIPGNSDSKTVENKLDDLRVKSLNFQRRVLQIEPGRSGLLNEIWTKPFYAHDKQMRQIRGAFDKKMKSLPPALARTISRKLARFDGWKFLNSAASQDWLLQEKYDVTGFISYENNLRQVSSSFAKSLDEKNYDKAMEAIRELDPIFSRVLLRESRLKIEQEPDLKRICEVAIPFSYYFEDEITRIEDEKLKSAMRLALNEFSGHIFDVINQEKSGSGF